MPVHSLHEHLQPTYYLLVDTTLRHFLIRLEPVRAAFSPESMSQDEQAVIAEHFEYLKRAVEAGSVLLAGRTLDAANLFGIVVAEVREESEARGILDKDPAVTGGVMRGTLMPFSLAVMRGRN